MDTVCSVEGNTKTSRTRKGEIRGRAWMVTLFDFSWTQIQSYLEGTDCEYVCQQERCPETEKLHFHVGIYFKNPRGIGFQKDWPEEGHWIKCKNWKATKKYCSKRDTRVAGPWSNIPGLKWRKTIRRPMLKNELYEWQKDIMKMIKEEPDFRSLWWYWSKEGLAGKTTFARDLMITHGAMMLQGASKYCIRAFLKTVIEDEIDQDVVIFNVTRTEYNSISYKSLETIKDGAGMSAFFDPLHGFWNPPHVLIFANFEPRWGAMSKDRWHVFEVTPDGGSRVTENPLKDD